MKVYLNISEKWITLPLDLLGLPTQTSSWVAKAEFFIGDELQITIHRKFFDFEKPSLFEQAESEAKKGFINRKDLEVKRCLGYKFHHHIPLKGAVRDSKAMLLKDDLCFSLETRHVATNITMFILTLDLRQLPDDFEKIRQVRSLLVG